MRTICGGALLTILTIALSLGCGSVSEQPRPPDCPENAYDLQNHTVRHVHDNGDGSFYLIQLHIDIEKIKDLLKELAADIINPFSGTEAKDLLALATDADIYTDLNITPCYGGPVP